MKPIKRIHDYGPEVGRWKSHGTVAQTFARARKQLAEQKQSNVQPLKREQHGR